MSDSSAPRWRVVVIDDHLPSRRALTAAIARAEGMVVARASAVTREERLAAGERVVTLVFEGQAHGPRA